jgi:hypothetical protein
VTGRPSSTAKGGAKRKPIGRLKRAPTTHATVLGEDGNAILAGFVGGFRGDLWRAEAIVVARARRRGTARAPRSRRSGHVRLWSVDARPETAMGAVSSRGRIPPEHVRLFASCAPASVRGATSMQPTLRRPRSTDGFGKELLRRSRKNRRAVSAVARLGPRQVLVPTTSTPSTAG